MKFAGVLFILCILFSSLALAAPDLVFDKTLNDKATISLNGTTYTVRIGTTNNSLIRLLGNNETIELDVGLCKTRGYDTFCYESYDDEQQITANQTDYRPIILVDRSISSKKIDLGQQTTITTTFENDGGDTVTDFVFTEKIPSFLTIVNASGCFISDEDNQMILFEELLVADVVNTCTYILEGNDAGKAIYEGKLETDLLVASTDAEAIPQVVIDVENPFEYDLQSSNYDLDAQQPFVLTLNFENTETGNSARNVTITANILTEEEFEIIEAPSSDFYVNLKDDFVRITSNIEAQEKLQQEIELKSLLIDEKISLDVEIIYQFSDETTNRSFTRTIDFNQTFKPLTCEYVVRDDAGNNLISLQKLNNTLPGYDQGEFYIKIYNENFYVNFEDISYQDGGDLSFPLFSSIRSLRRNGEDILTSTPFSFRFDEERKFTSDMTVKYKVGEELLESSCKGNVLIREPETIAISKELVYVRDEVDGVVKNFTRVFITLTNNFFEPILITDFDEQLPSYVFTNTEFNKSFELLEKDSKTITYDLIVPTEHLSTKKSTADAKTEFTYFIRDLEFTPEETITLRLNNIIAHQKGLPIDEIIDVRVDQIKEELNESISAQLAKQQNNSNSSGIAFTYSPFVNYFSLALFALLFFLVYLFLRSKYNIHYYFNEIISKLKLNKQIKDKEKFSQEYKQYKKSKYISEQKIVLEKKEVRKAAENLKKQKKKYDLSMDVISKEQKKLEKLVKFENNKISLLEDQRKEIDTKVAAVNRLLTKYQNDLEQLNVEKTKEAQALAEKKASFDQLENTLHLLEKRSDEIERIGQDIEKKHDKESSEYKRLLEKKKLKIKKELDTLRKTYDANRNILKEEEKHLDKERL